MLDFCTFCQIFYPALEILNWKHIIFEILKDFFHSIKKNPAFFFKDFFPFGILHFAILSYLIHGIVFFVLYHNLLLIKPLYISHLARKCRDDVAVNSFCSSQQPRKYVSNETPDCFLLKGPLQFHNVLKKVIAMSQEYVTTNETSKNILVVSPRHLSGESPQCCNRPL